MRWFLLGTPTVYAFVKSSSWYISPYLFIYSETEDNDRKIKLGGRWLRNLGQLLQVSVLRSHILPFSGIDNIFFSMYFFRSTDVCYLPSATRGFLSGITFSFVCFALCLFACAVFELTQFNFFRPRIMTLIVGLTLFFGLLLLALSILELPRNTADNATARVTAGIALIVGIVICTTLASMAAIRYEGDHIAKAVGTILFLLTTVAVGVVLIYVII